MSAFNPFVDGDDGDADREDAAFAKAEASELARLVTERHRLANQATVARLTADMLWLELDRLDAKIKELS